MKENAEFRSQKKNNKSIKKSLYSEFLKILNSRKGEAYDE
jgi:hypothetical protein